MSWFFAFLHHVAAFALVAAIAVEFVLIRDELTARRARQILFTDLVVGVSAGVVLVVGLLRVFYFEKGAAYYFQSGPFVIKLALFICVALISIYPTIQFLSWRGAVREGRAPVVPDRKLRSIRSILHLELAGILFLILFAALMAKGISFVG